MDTVTKPIVRMNLDPTERRFFERYLRYRAHWREHPPEIGYKGMIEGFADIRPDRAQRILDYAESLIESLRETE